MPGGVIWRTIGIAAGEDGVDFIETFVKNGRNLRHRLQFDNDAAALGEIYRLGRTEDTGYSSVRRAERSPWCGHRA